VDVASNATLGKFLVDGAGMTLYMFVPDKKSDSTCYEALNCAKSWPPFLTDTGKVDSKSTDIKTALFGTTKRKDGTTEVTFNGWPLYYFANDKKAGDTLGQGAEFSGGPWWVMAPDGGITVAPVTVQLTFNFGPGRDGTQDGTVRLRATPDNKTSVTIALKGSVAGVAQPAHIHEGACPAVGAVKYPLTNVADGASSTTIDAKFADLFTGGYSVNVHKSTAESGVYVACIGIPQGSVITMDKGRDGDLHGTAVLLAQGTKTEVDLFLTPNIGVVQPAHIHEGACPGVGAVKFPLTNIQEGHSQTVADAALADLLKGGYAINSHLSTPDIGKYVACGNLASAAK
jgi:predicted lipoprotein with Yx(FWY)xxD motif